MPGQYLERIDHAHRVALRRARRTSPPYPHRHARRRGGRAMSDMSRNEYLRGAMAAGAASFAESLTGERASVDGSDTAQALDHVQRLVDAASDRLTGALADAGQIESEVVTALHTIRARALAVAAQVDAALPLG